MIEPLGIRAWAINTKELSQKVPKCVSCLSNSLVFEKNVRLHELIMEFKAMKTEKLI
jgi:hypothetical protein